MSLFRKKGSPELVTQLQPEEPKEVPDALRFGTAYELTPEFLAHMLEHYDQYRGKFIRIGDLVLATPMEVGMCGHTSTAQHKDIGKRALQSWDDDFKKRIQDAQTLANTPDNRAHSMEDSGVSDAGIFQFSLQDGKVTNLQVYGDSAHFGRPTLESRDRTLEIVHQQFPDTNVTQK